MDYLHISGIRFIEWLQQFKGIGPTLINISQLGSPPMAYALVFPAAYYINPQLGLLTMLCTCFSEWLSGILKWVLYGHRPYWWVGIYAQQTGTVPIQIAQFPTTCETGPGSPSGHCMITLAAVLPVLLYAQHLLPSSSRVNYSRFYRQLMWILFTVFTILLGLSRLFLAAHFPHQVISGIMAGLAVGYLFAHLSLVTRLASEPNKSLLTDAPMATLIHWLHYPTPLLLFGFGSFFVAWLFSWFLQNVIGLDINWSIGLAKTACSRSEWVHLSTSLMVGFARIAGYLSGLALALAFYPPSKSMLLRSHIGLDVPVLACIAAALTKLFAEPACRQLIFSTLVHLLPTTSTGGPGMAMLLSSIVEGAIGPFFAIWILPVIISAFSSTLTQ